MLLACRFSSVQLLGDLLFHISGVTGKMTTETASEDDNFGTAASNKVRVHLHMYQKNGVGLFLKSVYRQRCRGSMTFDFISPRLSLELLALSGVIASSLASTWAVQTLSWWFDRLPSTCGRSWCPTPPELCERSSPPSSLFCWASWLPPALTRER